MQLLNISINESKKTGTSFPPFIPGNWEAVIFVNNWWKCIYSIFEY